MSFETFSQKPDTMPSRTRRVSPRGAIALGAGVLIVVSGLSIGVNSCKEAFQAGMASTSREVLGRIPLKGEMCLKVTAQPGQTWGDVFDQFQIVLESTDNQEFSPEFRAIAPEHANNALWPGDVFAACDQTGVIDPAKLTADQHVFTSLEAYTAYKNMFASGS